MSDIDMALEAFLASAKTYAPDLPESLLKSIYESQKDHQFEEGSDRGASLREMEKLVEEYLNTNPQGQL
jgi:hypothetical protein